MPAVKLIRTVARMLVLISVLNFCAFWYGMVLLGGSALGGKMEGGRYFVEEKGKYTEVSELQFRYSDWHTKSMIGVHLIGMISALLLTTLNDPFVGRKTLSSRLVSYGIVVGLVLIAIVSTTAAAWFVIVVVPALSAASVLWDWWKTSAD